MTRILLVLLIAGAGTTARAQTADVPDPAADLLSRLHDLPGVVRAGSDVLWEAGDGRRLRIEGEVEGEPWIETALGGIRIDRTLFEPGASRGARALEPLVGLAVRDGVPPAEGIAGRLSGDPLLGLHLALPAVDPGAIVLPEGALRRMDAPPAEPGPARRLERLSAAIAALEVELARSPLDGLARDAIRHVLSRLVLPDDPEAAEDELAPSFARRLVRHGWLARTGAPWTPGAAGELEAAVADAGRAVAAVEYRGAGTSLAILRDAFGAETRVLERPAGSSIATRPPRPMNLLGLARGMAASTVVAEFEPGAALSREALLSARLVHPSGELARWSRAEGLSADPARWATAFLGATDLAARHYATGFFPPHVPVVDLEGDLVALLTRGGALDPPGGPAPAWLDRAAAILPDAASLDLIGHYVFVYVYDSPDTTRPALVGNRVQKGEIHQTAAETLADVAGGQCRGDCDDLAELYHEIARRQGCLAHVIGLPGHAATAWAQEQGERWHVFVLQTGPALEFVADRLPDALEAAYERFEKSATFDPDNLTIQLRFEGENTRSRWNLSWRMFSDRRYAETMIDVQRDWHFHTYLRAVRKMERLIAAGDEDPSNFREVASLHDFTGRHAESCTFLEGAIERTTDPASRLYLTADLAARRLDAGRRAEGEALAERILAEDLPAVVRAGRIEGLSVQRFGIDFASALAARDAAPTAIRVLDELVREEIARRLTAVAAYLASDRFDAKAWANQREIRTLLRSFVNAVVEILERTGPRDLPDDPRLVRLAALVETWLDRIAFRDLSGRDDLGERYATAGRFYAAMLGHGTLRDRLVRTPAPAAPGPDHALRAGGLVQFELDLPWIRSSPAYWRTALADLVSPPAAPVDPAEARALGALLEESVARARELGTEAPRVQRNLLCARVALGVLTADEAALREALSAVRDRKDRALREEAARWIGLTAPSVPVERLERAVRLWHEEVGSKPEILRIAWRAAADGARRHGVAAARVAAACHPDDATFAEEAAELATLFAD